MSSLEEGTKPIVKKRKRNVNNNNNTNNTGIWQWCMNCLKLKSKHLRVIIIMQVILLLFFSTLYVKGYHKDIWMYLSYYTRPLWDNAGPPPFEVIQHFYAEDVPIETLCQVNGWEFAGNNSHKLADAVIFSNELDLLEIRWRELMPYVDYFFIVESDKTFTNKPKELTFAVNRERFAFAGSKVIYDVFVAPPVTEAEAREGFPLEGRLRNFMSQLIRKTLQNDDRLIMADVDEIPSRDTAKLLKYCDGYPEILHLGLRNYIYSFEFPITHQAGYVGISPGSYQWRPQVHKYGASTFYMHSQGSEYLLAESGWHCSFCFRYIEDFVFKMTSYSHSDRVRHENFLDHARIQKIVCDGTDIFEMPAESFTWYDVVLNFFATPKTQSVVHLPVQLVEHPKLYPFLLPGNCIREKKH